MNENSSLSKGKKITIIGLLLLIVVLLSVLLLIPSNNSSKKSNKYDSPNNVSNVTRTLMIYIDGSNLESESAIATGDLEAIKYENIDLEKNNVLIYTGGTLKWWNFVSNNENAIYKLTKDGFVKVQSYSKLNMGDSNTLTSFMKYVYDNYKTDAYDLVLYDHGGAIDGAIYDDFTKDNLSLYDLSKSLEASPFNSKNKLEFIMFRTCLNGTLEVANVFKNYANYMISSEEITLGHYLYPVLGFISDIKTSNSTIDIGKSFIDNYHNIITYGATGGIVYQTYSIMDLSKVDKVDKLVNEYFKNLNVNTDYARIAKVRASLYQYATHGEDADYSYDMVDLYTLVNKLGNNNKDLLNAIDELVVYNKTNEPDSKGVSIYFPYNGAQAVKQYFLNIYDGIVGLADYKTFINSFYNYSTSNSTTSFASFNSSTPSADSKSREVEIELSDEQVKNYAKARYVIFKKKDDGKYTPVYSSDNVELKKNKLKTKLENNLIKIVDKEDGNNEYYLPIISSNNDKTKLTTLVVYDWNPEKEMSDWFTESAYMYFDIKDNKVNNTVITQINKKNSNGASGAIIDENKLTSLQFSYSSYIITDENGNYVENWSNNGVVTAIDVKPGKYEFKVASLDNEDNYYAVFIVDDIYGHRTHSSLIKVK